MGTIVKVTCGLCRSEWERRVGSGLMHGSLDVAASLYPEKVKQEILGRGQEEDLGFDFAYRLAYCEQCCELVSVPELKIREEEAAYIGDCPQCGGKAEPVKDAGSLPCPVCHRLSLRTEETGLWD